MNATELKLRLPNASPTFIRLNATDAGQADIPHSDTGPSPKLERHTGNGTVGEVSVQKGNRGRFLVRVTAYRTRLLDDDNVCEKFHVDLCRYAGIIPGDSRATTRIEGRCEKTEPGAAEEVVIEIFQTD